MVAGLEVVGVGQQEFVGGPGCRAFELSNNSPVCFVPEFIAVVVVE